MSITIAFFQTNERKLYSAKEGDIVTIGSSPLSNICQKHKVVCETHCNIRYSITYKNWVVESAISSSHTYLNSEMVVKARILKNHDRVQLGINGPILSIGIRNQSISHESKSLLSSGPTLVHSKDVSSSALLRTSYTNQQNHETSSSSKNYGIAGNFKLLLYSFLCIALTFIIVSATSLFEGSNSFSSVVTLEKFNQISIGMTYAEVVNLIGKKGSINVTSETTGIENFIPNTNIKVVTWENQDGSSITAMFTNEKLDTKIQIGLD